MQNEFHVSFKGTPETAEAFAGKKPGDKCRFLAEVTITENDADHMAGSIEAIKPAASYEKPKLEPKRELSAADLLPVGDPQGEGWKQVEATV